MRVNWVFLDMNSFFASAEQHLRPELRGRAVGVIPTQTERTCVIAASVDAKRLGVRVGTPVPEARKLCPGIALIKARPDVYVRLHHAIGASIDKHLPIHKAYSIDEWAMRLLGHERTIDRATELAHRIKAQIAQDHSPWLRCSVGVAPTRLLAKIACELRKPDGLTVLTPDDLPERVAHLKPRDLTGISTGIEARLAAHGVVSIEQLWGLSRRKSIQIWGSVAGAQWWAGFHGHDEPEQTTQRRSMSHANVLEPRFRSEDGARQMLARLISRLGARLRQDEMLAGRISYFVRCQGDGGQFEASGPLGQVSDTPSLLRVFADLWEDRPAAIATPMMVGACVSGLVHHAQATGCLFGEPEADKRLSSTLDAINRRWGPSAAYFGALHGCSHEMDEKIAFGRIPATLGRPPAAE